jgi:hypothetical protein
MKFLCLYKPGKESTGPTQDDIEKMGKFIDEMTRSGVLLATEGCMDSSKGARVRIHAGEYTVTDGPFPETKELVAGLAIIQVNSKAEAIEATKRFLAVVGEGESTILQLNELPGHG